MLDSSIDLTPRINRIYQHCKEVFTKYGIKVDFPKNTDPINTYKWRYVKNFVMKMDEYGISDETAFIIIDALIENAYKKKRIQCGLSILTSGDMLDIANKYITNKNNYEGRLLKSIADDHNKYNSVDFLEMHGKLPLLVRLYMCGEISDSYIASSKKVAAAMSKMDKINRGLLPDSMKLIKIRMGIKLDPKLRIKVIKILGSDWNNV